MIRVRRLNGKEFIINAELIVYIEETPDTVVTLTTGQKMLVKENSEELVDKVLEYKWRIQNYKSIEG